MALTVHFFTFAKKVNSTAVPSQGTETSVLVELKDPCDLRALQLKIGGSISNPTIYNYCYAPTFNRFYFIQNWTWDNGYWIAGCKVDTLASYRTTILASSQYILRSALVSDGFIRDTIYPATAKYDISMADVDGSRPLTAQVDTGYYIVGIIARNGSLGTTNYYIFTPAAFDNLKNALFTDITWAGISSTAMDNDLLKCFMNPYDYIVSCKWCAITSLLSLIANTAVSSVYLGWWTFPISGGVYRIDTNAYPFIAWAFNIPALSFGSHPQTSRGAYLNQEPYAEYNIALAPYGFIKIPSVGAIYGVEINECIDIINGTSYLTVYAKLDNDIAPIVTYETDFLVDIQLAQVRSGGDWKSTLIDAGAGLAGNVFDVMGDGPLKNALTGITSAVREQNTNIKVGSPNGSLVQFGRFANFQAHIMSIFYLIADEDNTHLGRPYCKEHALSTLSGYTLCASADIAINGTDEEAAEINRFLNSGFFIE